MTAPAAPAASGRARGGVFLAVACVLLLVGLAVALTPFDRAESYCGRVAWDTNREGACSAAMRARTAASVALLGAAAVGFGVRFAWRAPFVLSAVAVVLVAIGMIRLLEPTDDAWCGSSETAEHFIGSISAAPSMS